MPETLYDGFIRREIAAEAGAFHEAKLIGRVLGKYKLGVGDAWIALRIEEMIHSRELEAYPYGGRETGRVPRDLLRYYPTPLRGRH